jgi:glutathione synthase
MRAGPGLARWRRGVGARGGASRLTARRHTTGTRPGAEEAVLPLTAFDAVLMRQDPPFDFEYVAATWLLERAAGRPGRGSSTPALDARPFREARHHRVPAVHPDHGRGARGRHLQAFIDAHGDAILKPLDGMGGSQIFRVRARRPQPQRHRRDADPARRAHHHGAALPARHRRRRQAHPADRRRGRALRAGAHPKAGETRGNLAAGGTRRGAAADRRATARSPNTWRRSCGRAASCSSAST